MPLLEVSAKQFGSSDPNRVGDWMQTFTGRAFYQLDPRPEDIDLEDIAHALAHICRYLGHIQKEGAFYSVAEHSVRVAESVRAFILECWQDPDNSSPNRLLLPVELRDVRAAGIYDFIDRFTLTALLHDAEEAYMCDIPRPFKRHLLNYGEIAGSISALIAAKYGTITPEPALIKEFDTRILHNEKTAFMNERVPLDWCLAGNPIPGLVLDGWSPARAEYEFLMMFCSLTGYQDAKLDKRLVRLWDFCQ